jgi:thioesterase domain-containing protein
MDDAEMLLAVLEEPEPHLLEHLRRLDPDEQARYVLEVAQQKNALPPDFGLAQFRHLFNIFKINYQALRDYVPKFYPGRVTLFRASEELAKHPDRLTLGWERIAQDVETHIVPGNHFNMAYIPHVSVLAEQLGICLSKARAESSSAAV